MSLSGPSRYFAAAQQFGPFLSKADIRRRLGVRYVLEGSVRKRFHDLAEDHFLMLIKRQSAQHPAYKGDRTFSTALVEQHN
jgi:hypothetical protein